jgi:hypothetical protein
VARGQRRWSVALSRRSTGTRARDRIEKRPFAGNRPTLKRRSVEEFAAWYAEREARRQEKRERAAQRSRERFKPPAPQGWMSAADAAELLGVKLREVYWLAGHGYLQSTRTPSRRWFDAASVEERRRHLAEDSQLWVSGLEAARIVGCSADTIQRAVSAGKIERRPGARRQPSLRRSSVQAFARARSL